MLNLQLAGWSALRTCMLVICFSWISVAVGEVGVDWGLAKVRRPRLRHSNIVLNQSEAEDSRGKKESAWHVLETKLAAVVDYAVMQRNLRCMSGRSQMEDESAKTAFQSDAVNAGSRKSRAPTRRHSGPWTRERLSA